MSPFQKTRVMNLIGAAGLAITGVALLFNKFGEQSVGVLASIIAIYVLLIWIPVGTARALSKAGNYKLQRQMLWLNWGLICVYGCGVAVTVVATIGSADVMKRMVLAMMPGVIIFVLPELINIRALRSKLAECRSSAGSLES